MVFENKNIAFIGAGVMGEAMINGLLSKNLVQPQQIIASDPNTVRGQELIDKYNIQYTESNLEATEAADVMVLSVKPQVMDKVLPPLRGHANDIPLILSIVAGVRMRKIVGELGNSRIVRSMPNTPAQIGQGITVWSATLEVVDEQRKQAQLLLSALGEEIYVDDEKYLDMATALSGTGPAYVFLFMEALIDAGVHMGFSRRIAEQLVLQTISGSVDYALESGLHPAQLRNQVTSPGGTTASALFEMEKGGIRTIVSKAIWAAHQRSIDLGKDDD